MDDFTKGKIDDLSNSHLISIISDFYEVKKSGRAQKIVCPFCQEQMEINNSKSIWKCFHCDKGGKGAISFIMEAKNFEYMEAVQHIATKFGINLDENEKQKTAAGKNKHLTKSFCDAQLESSGLTKEDISASTFNEFTGVKSKVQTFVRGTIDQYGRLLENQGDDMIIRYFDLAGKEITYIPDKGNNPKAFYRIRFQFPEQHLDKYGNPMKYRSPAGSGVHIYIPERIRQLFQQKRKIKRLFIQEGEKKSEKATKHGILSIGVTGIHALAQNGHLPSDLQMIVTQCEVDEVVFILDSDWDLISGKIKPIDDCQRRPRTFYIAVKNYRDYFKTFYNSGLKIKILFGYIKKGYEKGIDDLLSGTLKNKEADLLDEIDKILNSKEKEGDFIKIHEIDAASDLELQKIWDLDNAKNFAERHRQILEALPEFMIHRHKWRFREGKFESAQPIEENEQYWEEVQKTDRQGNKIASFMQFRYVRALNFLFNRGFGRIQMANKDLKIVRVVNKVVEQKEHFEIHDFICDFTKQIDRNDVLEILYRGLHQYLGPMILNRLEQINPVFERASKKHQFLYFSNFALKITADAIETIALTEIENYIWEDHIIKFTAEKLQPLFNIQYSESADADQPGAFDFEITSLGKKCHFLQFIINTSDFTWRQRNANLEIEPGEEKEKSMHIVAKLCAIGYLLHTYKDPTTSKAIICMDGRNSEIGDSNGRSGKSLWALAPGMIYPQKYVGGKSRNLTDDNFLYDGIDEKTKTILFDDVRANVDFEHFFPLITGNLLVNMKGGKRFTLSFEDTPKAIFTTNFAINGEGSSFRDRQWLLAFSDFYNEKHKPIDDFGVPFFREWDFEQWNLFYNLMSECIQLYFKYGCIESPSERVTTRKLRQIMGETFLLWAEEFYSSEDNINMRLERQSVYTNFIDKFPEQRKFITPTHFKKKLKAFCEYKKYRYNPQKLDPVTNIPIAFDKDGLPILDDKTGGVEYITIANEEFQNL